MHTSPHYAQAAFKLSTMLCMMVLSACTITRALDAAYIRSVLKTSPAESEIIRAALEAGNHVYLKKNNTYLSISKGHDKDIDKDYLFIAKDPDCRSFAPGVSGDFGIEALYKRAEEIRKKIDEEAGRGRPYIVSEAEQKATIHRPYSK